MKLSVTVILYFASVTFGSEHDYDLSLERIEHVKGETDDPLLVFDDLRVTRYNRTMYVINGKLKFTRDADDNDKFVVSTHHSSRSDGHFQKNAMKIQPQGACEFLRVTYTLYLMEDLKGHSNFPYINPGETICPFKKGEYYVSDLVISKYKFPPHINPGLWKVELLIMRDGVLNSGLALYVRVVGLIE